jgi:hypothetical protein
MLCWMSKTTSLKEKSTHDCALTQRWRSQMLKLRFSGACQGSRVSVAGSSLVCSGVG